MLPKFTRWGQLSLYLTYKAAMDSISNSYAGRCMSLAVSAQLKTDQESSHDREGIRLQHIRNR
jgi:hypothetical protein